MLEMIFQFSSAYINVVLLEIFFFDRQTKMLNL